MDNIIVVAILAVILGLAIWYIVRAKKGGKKCIGCPNECSLKKGGCGGGCNGCHGCFEDVQNSDN